MRKIRRKNYTNYIIIACICIFSVMGIGYGYLQQSLDINLGLSKKAIDITDNVISSGDGLYEDQYEDGRYVYRGSEPNNYIKFNDELWRIIAKEADGTYKIVRNFYLGLFPFDKANHRLTTNNTFCDSPSSGCSVYGAVSGTYTLGSKSGTVTEDYSLAEYLNGEYYNSILTPTSQEQVQRHTFNIGGVLRLDQSGNDSIAKNLASEKGYQWTGNIGLLNVTDILRASTNQSCTSATVAISPNTCATNYLVDNIPSDEFYWTMNGIASESSTSSYDVWTVTCHGSSGVQLSSSMAIVKVSVRDRPRVHPVLFLKSTTQIIDGDGSKSDPYIIS